MAKDTQKNITNEMVDWTFASDVIVEKVYSVSADAEGKKAGDTKQVTGRFMFGGVTLRAIIADAVRSAVIKRQNGQDRATFAKLPKTLEISMARPGAKIETRADKVSKLVAMGVPVNVAEIMVDNPTAASKLTITE